MPGNQADNITLLLQAAHNGQLDEVQRLVEVEGVDPGARNNAAIIWAAKNGHAAIVERLLRYEGVNPADQNNAALIWAAESGHLETLECLLRRDDVNPADQNNAALIRAALKGHSAIVERLLSCEGVNPADQDNIAIIGASEKGHSAIVERLLSCKDVNPADQNNAAIIGAARNGHLEAVERLLRCDDVNAADQNNAALIWAAESGHLETLECLLRRDDVNPADQNDAALIRAALKGHFAIVERLLSCEGVNPADQDNIAIIGASEKGHSAIVERLLSCKDVNPADQNNAAIIGAARNGHAAIVERLLRCDDVNAAAQNNVAIIGASENGHFEIVERLLSCKDVNPADQNNAAIIRAARNGHAAIVERLLDCEDVNPSDEHNAALIRAARNGHTAIVDRLLSCGHEHVNPADRNNAALIWAAKNGHAVIVERLLSCKDVNPADQNNAALIRAAQNGHAAIVERLLRCDDVNPADRNNAALILAAASGHLETVECLLRRDEVNPADRDDLALIRAAQNGHSAIVERLLRCDGVNPVAQSNLGIMMAAVSGHLGVVIALLADGRVRLQPSHITQVSRSGQTEIANFLALTISPIEQIAQLITVHESVLSYERIRGLSGEESSMHLSLERQAAQQRSLLSERYVDESLPSGLSLLRRLVFGALQAHLERPPLLPATEERRAFLSAHMDNLIAGDAESLSGAAALFNSNEDIYEIASRAVNAQAPFVTWPNLLTAVDEAGEWVQSYAGNIAREIAASEGQPHHDTCLYALIYRLAEIRRAHNEGDMIGIDNPSCFPGTKTRLLKVLGTHPDHKHHIRAEWKSACYEGAVRHIEQVFGQVLDKMDSPEEAEQLLDALLMMRLENKEAIQSGDALLGVNGDRQVYTEEHCAKRYAFILKMRKGLQESVNAYLCEQGLEPISQGDSKTIYLSFLGTALGEEWISPRLTSTYAEHAPKALSEEVLEAVPAAAQPMSLRMAQARQQQALQGLKRRFYEYCEQHHPEVEVSAGEVNAFFAGVEMPAGADETAFFEDAFKQLASDESNEGRQSPSP